MFPVALAIALALLPHALSSPAASQAEPARAGREQLLAGKYLAARAFVTGEAALLREARDLFAAAVAARPDDPNAAFHLASCESRLVNAHGIPDEDRERALDAAVSGAERVLVLDPDHADAMALLSGLLGQRIARNFVLGPVLGPRCDALLERAVELEPDNPRVQLALGTSKLFTPAMFGGDVDRAVSCFERAAALAERGFPDDPLAPDPCRLEALAWLGQAHEKAGRPGRAREVYERALAIEPCFAWVAKGLLPRLLETIPDER